MTDTLNPNKNILAADLRRLWQLSDDETERVQIGSRIKSLRQHRGDLTLDQLSELTKLVDPFGKGISRVSLSRYETGAAFPGVREIKLLARALRATVSYMFYGDNEDPMNFVIPDVNNAIMDIVYQVLAAQKLVTPRGDVEPMGDEFMSLVAQVKGQNKNSLK